MTDFVKAFKTGVEAAEKVQLARKEIESIIDDLSTQIAKETNGKLQIYRTTLPEQVPPGFIPFGTPRTYEAIVAINPEIQKSPLKELAKWSMARTGYPCKLIWGDQEITCIDKVGLEKAFIDLISDPIIAESLFALIHLEDS